MYAYVRRIASFLSFFIISFIYAQCDYLVGLSITYGYIAARGGFAWHQPIEITASRDTTRTNYKIGPTGSVSIGIGINALRLEAECFMAYNDLDDIDLTIPPPDPIAITLNGNGRIRHLAFMFNTFYDFCMTPCTTLYLGVGCGFDFYHRERSVNGVFTEKDANLFAFQFMPGLTYHLTSFLDITMGYRLYMTEYQKTESGMAKTNKIPILHSFEIGFRYKL